MQIKWYKIQIERKKHMDIVQEVLLVLVWIYLLDHVATYSYCKLQIYKDKKYGDLMEDKPQYTDADVSNYKFPKKQVKVLFHLYKGWIRYKLNVLGRIPCHSYRNWILRHVYLMKMSKNVVLYATSGNNVTRFNWKTYYGYRNIIYSDRKHHMLWVGIRYHLARWLRAGISDFLNPSIDKEISKYLASNTHPKQYAEDPVGTIMTNICGCDNLLKLAVEKKARFLLASSVEIYGQGTEVPMDEKYCGYIDCNLARSGYNEAKRTCEALTQSYRNAFGVDAVIARFARVFGADKKHDTKAMSQFMDKAVLGEDIILKSKGQQRYSYCYIADAVSGLFKLLLDGQDGEAYNISDDDEGLTLGEYAEYIASLANLKVRYEIENNESVSKATYALLDTRKIKNIGWEPQYSVKDGLKRTYTIKKETLGSM